ncbi:MAG: hypothetical protein P9M11_05495 [Candidatus Tenebribacter burtonii]|jgi:hypothetical protein|nr:hypothetical protein [Candidatus Tenebribacter burtonii]
MKLLLIVVFISSSLLLLGIEKIDGFRDYKFGMSIDEANELYDDDSIITKDFPKVGDLEYPELKSNIYKCLFKRILLYNHWFNLYVLFDNKTNCIFRVIIVSTEIPNTMHYEIAELIKDNIITTYKALPTELLWRYLWRADNGNYIIFETTPIGEKNILFNSISFVQATGL